MRKAALILKKQLCQLLITAAALIGMAVILGFVLTHERTLRIPPRATDAPTKAPQNALIPTAEAQTTTSAPPAQPDPIPASKKAYSEQDLVNLVTHTFREHGLNLNLGLCIAFRESCAVAARPHRGYRERARHLSRVISDQFKLARHDRGIGDGSCLRYRMECRANRVRACHVVDDLSRVLARAYLSNKSWEARRKYVRPPLKRGARWTEKKIRLGSGTLARRSCWIQSSQPSPAFG